jgi:MFS family permease
VAMSMSFATGLIVGSIIATLVKRWKKITQTLLIGIIGLYTGLFIIGIPGGLLYFPGLSIDFSSSYLGIRFSFWIIMAGGFITTLGIPIFSTIAVTMIQLSVPIEKMGRFSGFMGALMGFFTPIAYLLSGYLGTIIYIPWVIMGSSIIAIILMILLFGVSNIGKIEPIMNEKLDLIERQTEAQNQTQDKGTPVSVE